MRVGAWWVIESVFLRRPDKVFWACLEHSDISHSSAIPGSDTIERVLYSSPVRDLISGAALALLLIQIEKPFGLNSLYKNTSEL